MTAIIIFVVWVTFVLYPFEHISYSLGFSALLKKEDCIRFSKYLLLFYAAL